MVVILFIIFAVLFAVTWKDSRKLPDEKEDDEFVVPLDCL